MSLLHTLGLLTAICVPPKKAPDPSLVLRPLPGLNLFHNTGCCPLPVDSLWLLWALHSSSGQPCILLPEPSLCSASHLYPPYPAFYLLLSAPSSLPLPVPAPRAPPPPCHQCGGLPASSDPCGTGTSLGTPAPAFPPSRGKCVCSSCSLHGSEILRGGTASYSCSTPVCSLAPKAYWPVISRSF